MKLFKYLTISFVAANIPWIGWGVIFGWPAILGISLVLTLLDSKLMKMNWAEVFLLTLFIGFIVNALNCLGWDIESHVDIMDLGMLVLASPSILVGAILVTYFKPKKVTCCCPIHEN